MTLTQEDLRFVGVWAADCAERVLPLFEAKASSDARPREAIEGVRELAAVDDPNVGDEEIRWAIEHASPAVREVARRFPVRGLGRSRLDALLYQFDAGLRSGR